MTNRVKLVAVIEVAPTIIKANFIYIFGSYNGIKVLAD